MLVFPNYAKNYARAYARRHQIPCSVIARPSECLKLIIMFNIL